MSLPISLVVSGGTGKTPDQPLGNIDVLAGTSLLMHIKDLAKIKNVVAMFGAAVSCTGVVGYQCIVCLCIGIREDFNIVNNGVGVASFPGSPPCTQLLRDL